MYGQSHLCLLPSSNQFLCNVNSIIFQLFMFAVDMQMSCEENFEFKFFVKKKLTDST